MRITKNIVLLSIFLMSSLLNFSQSLQDSIMKENDTLFFNFFQYEYNKTIIPPEYGDGNDMNNYIVNNILPLMQDCIDSLSPTEISAYFLLTISELGIILNVKKIRSSCDININNMIIQELLNMGKWKSARRDEKPVPSKILLPIIQKNR